MNIQFDESEHVYTMNGSRRPGVTNIIKEVLGDSWSVNPWYLERGRAVHACASFIAQGKDFKFDERIAGEVAAIKRFFAEVRPEVISQEMLVGSEVYGYCGTLDFCCKIGGRRVLIDYKHSLDSVRTPLQIGGYAQAYKETAGYEIPIGYGVEIRSNGTYSMSDKIDVLIWRNKFLAVFTAFKLKGKLGNLSWQKERKDGDWNTGAA